MCVCYSIRLLKKVVLWLLETPIMQAEELRRMGNKTLLHLLFDFWKLSVPWPPGYKWYLDHSTACEWPTPALTTPK